MPAGRSNFPRPSRPPTASRRSTSPSPPSATNRTSRSTAGTGSSDAAAHDGARLREGLIDPNNTAAGVWADSAYRSEANEDFLGGLGKVSHIHRKKPKGKPMPRRTAKANAAKSAVRAHVEHPFAHQKGVMGLVIRTIGRARAEAAVTLSNMAYNMKRWCWLDRRTASA